MTQEEHKIFMEEYEKHGNNCMQIARVLSTWTPAQIKKHAQCFFTKKLNTILQQWNNIKSPSLPMEKHRFWSNMPQTKISTISFTWRQLKLLSAYAMLLPPMHRCCHCHHHAAAAFPNALLLPLKLRFRQADVSAAKLAAATVLPPRPPLNMCGNRRATTAYKIKKNVILLTYRFFTTMVTAARSDNCGATRQRQWQCCYLQLPRIVLMLWSDKRDGNSSIKP